MDALRAALAETVKVLKSVDGTDPGDKVMVLFEQAPCLIEEAMEVLNAPNPAPDVIEERTRDVEMFLKRLNMRRNNIPQDIPTAPALTDDPSAHDVLRLGRPEEPFIHDDSATEEIPQRRTRNSMCEDRVPEDIPPRRKQPHWAMLRQDTRTMAAAPRQEDSRRGWVPPHKACKSSTWGWDLRENAVKGTVSEEETDGVSEEEKENEDTGGGVSAILEEEEKWLNWEKCEGRHFDIGREAGRKEGLTHWNTATTALSDRTPPWPDAVGAQPWDKQGERPQANGSDVMSSRTPPWPDPNNAPWGDRDEPLSYRGHHAPWTPTYHSDQIPPLQRPTPTEQWSLDECYGAEKLPPKKMNHSPAAEAGESPTVSMATTRSVRPPGWDNATNWSWSDDQPAKKQSEIAIARAPWEWTDRMHDGSDRDTLQGYWNVELGERTPPGPSPRFDNASAVRAKPAEAQNSMYTADARNDMLEGYWDAEPAKKTPPDPSPKCDNARAVGGKRVGVKSSTYTAGTGNDKLSGAEENVDDVAKLWKRSAVDAWKVEPENAWDSSDDAYSWFNAVSPAAHRSRNKVKPHAPWRKGKSSNRLPAVVGEINKNKRKSRRKRIDGDGGDPPTSAHYVSNHHKQPRSSRNKDVESLRPQRHSGEIETRFHDEWVDDDAIELAPPSPNAVDNTHHGETLKDQARDAEHFAQERHSVDALVIDTMKRIEVELIKEDAVEKDATHSISAFPLSAVCGAAIHDVPEEESPRLPLGMLRGGQLFDDSYFDNFSHSRSGSPTPAPFSLSRRSHVSASSPRAPITVQARRKEGGAKGGKKEDDTTPPRSEVVDDLFQRWDDIGDGAQHIHAHAIAGHNTSSTLVAPGITPSVYDEGSLIVKKMHHIEVTGAVHSAFDGQKHGDDHITVDDIFQKRDSVEESLVAVGGASWGIPPVSHSINDNSVRRHLPPKPMQYPQPYVSPPGSHAVSNSSNVHKDDAQPPAGYDNSVVYDASVGAGSHDNPQYVNRARPNNGALSDDKHSSESNPHHGTGLCMVEQRCGHPSDGAYLHTLSEEYNADFAIRRENPQQLSMVDRRVSDCDEVQRQPQHFAAEKYHSDAAMQRENDQRFSTPSRLLGPPDGFTTPGSDNGAHIHHDMPYWMCHAAPPSCIGNTNNTMDDIASHRTPPCDMALWKSHEGPPSCVGDANNAIDDIVDSSGTTTTIHIGASAPPSACARHAHPGVIRLPRTNSLTTPYQPVFGVLHKQRGASACALLAWYVPPLALLAASLPLAMLKLPLFVPFLLTFALQLGRQAWMQYRWQRSVDVCVLRDVIAQLCGAKWSAIVRHTLKMVEKGGLAMRGRVWVNWTGVASGCFTIIVLACIGNLPLTQTFIACIAGIGLILALPRQRIQADHVDERFELLEAALNLLMDSSGPEPRPESDECSFEHTQTRWLSCRMMMSPEPLRDVPIVRRAILYLDGEVRLRLPLESTTLYPSPYNVQVRQTLEKPKTPESSWLPLLVQTVRCFFPLDAVRRHAIQCDVAFLPVRLILSRGVTDRPYLRSAKPRFEAVSEIALGFDCAGDQRAAMQRLSCVILK
eukprot:GEMP01000740.1.p1 GENE.GEMP01000740.1~~GEMP01000740.1.p1  ORF type:complete len:1571 (+),score=435.07 GEMP01000740.1:80-4792(+)